MPRRKKKEKRWSQSARYRIPREKIPKYTTRFYGWTGMSGESDSTISLKTDDIDWTRVAIAPRERNMRWFTRPRKIEPASRCNAPFRYLDITLCISFRAALLECFVPASCPRENNCIIRGGIEHRVFNRVPPFLYSIEHVRCYLYIGIFLAPNGRDNIN